MADQNTDDQMNADLQNDFLGEMVPSTVKFVCPNDGEISQDDVVFLCNKCERADLMYTGGVYMCPACLKPGENFQCMLCDSKEVKMELNS